MAKKSNLFSSVRRCFTPKKRKTAKNGKKGKGNWGHGETKSFVPFFRPPSSVEKILGEADKLNILPRVSLESLKIIEKPASPKSVSPRASSSPKALSPITRDPYPKITLQKASSAGSTGEVEASHLKKPASTLSSETCAQTDLFLGKTLGEAFPAVSSNGGDPSFSETGLKVETKRLKIPALNALSKTCHHGDLDPEHALDESFPAASSDDGHLCSPGTGREVETSYVRRAVLGGGDENTSALKIQAAYRGYLARRHVRALKGLMRLQALMRGQSMRQQTMNTLKQTQFLVRAQTQIQSLRIQMPEQGLQHQAHPVDKGAEGRPSWNRSKDWDNSVLTKEEEDARIRKKVEAAMKRERAMAYAYSHHQQPWNSNARSPRTDQDLRFNGYPWCWNWFDRYLAAAEVSYGKNAVSRSASTPRKPQLYPTCSKDGRGHDTPLKDEESLVSCPPSTMSPRYMTPTISAMAKVRANTHSNKRLPATPDRRFSFPLTPKHSSFRHSASPTGRHLESPTSIMSSAVNSRLSTPVLAARKPCDRS